MPTIYTDRKDLPERRENDFYETPIELCRAALQLDIFQTFFRFSKEKHLRILDPGFGTGVWGKAWKEVYPKRQDILEGIDIVNRYNDSDKIYTSWKIEDYLTSDFSSVVDKYDIIMGNPPYENAEEFIRKSLGLLTKKDSYGTPKVGLLIFLLKTTFLNSQKRAKGLYKEFPPIGVYVSGRRPSFSGDRKTNADDYSIFIWLNAPMQMYPRLHWFMWEYDNA